MLFVDAGNDRIGIGTNSPQRTLHIVGPDGSAGVTEGNSNTALYIDNNDSCILNIQSGTGSTDYGAIFFSDAEAQNQGAVKYDHTSNQLEFNAGGQRKAYVNTDKVVINEDSENVDFRVESNNFANMLFVNGGTDRVGIGTNSPTTTLDVSKDSTSNIRVGGAGGGSVDTRFYIDNVGNGGSGRGVGMSFRPSGSSNSVEAVKLIGYQQTAASTANNAKFAIQVANSSGTLTERVSIDNVGTFNITGSLTVNGSAVGGETAFAYVNFNGKNTPSIRDDFNVSSITDNQTGDYSVNFSSNASSANYTAAGHGGDPNEDGEPFWTQAISTSAFRGWLKVPNSGRNDRTYVMCTIHGG